MSRAVIVVALFVGLLAGGSVGVIVGASTAPQLHACVQKTTSLMRYTTGTTCKAGEKLVTWNTQGPAGPKGATGAQGPAGSGEGGGPLRFYLAEAKTIQVPHLSSQIQFLRLPPGSYLIEVQGQYRPAKGAADMSCDVYASTVGTLDIMEGYASATFPFYFSSSVYRTFTSQQTIRVSCDLPDVQPALATPGTASAQILAYPAERQPDPGP